MKANIRDTVKKRERIHHNRLDDDIDELIDTAKADMIRAGVDADIVGACGSLVKQAAVTFCQKEMTEERNLIDKSEESYKIQLDNLRKSSDVGEPVKPEEG